MEILNTTESANRILQIIERAEEEMIIISPYLDIKKKYKKAIINNKKANFVFIYGKTHLNDDVNDFLINQYNVTILVVKDLHAKIYMSEKECLISSMNLYKFSEENNFEISTYTNNKKDLEKIEKLIENELINTNKIFTQKLAKKLIKEDWGYCIRTGKKIDFNPEKPFCYEAFTEWNKYKNAEYKEKFCHRSGKPSFGKTSFKNPILED